MPPRGHLVLPLAPGQTAARTEEAASGPPGPPLCGLPQPLVAELWASAEAEMCGLAMEEFSEALAAIAKRFNCGLSEGAVPAAAAQAAFLRGLRLPDLALAAACALGHEAAWERFIGLYRSSLTRAATAITGSATLGDDLADSLYAELYGLRGGKEGRRSPLSSYSGRGSLLGWLRATLAQRHVDRHRRSRRETPLDVLDPPTPEEAPAPVPAELAHLAHAVARTLQAVGAEDRFLLSAYFLDRQTLLQISRTIRVHEATVSRRVKRLTGDLRKNLLQQLQSGGLSRRAAEEALGTDPRDIEINLRSLLQTSATPPFRERTDRNAPSEGRPDQPPTTGKTPAMEAAK